MLYADFIHKVIDLTIVEADNGLCYLEPMWKTILSDNKLNIRQISDNKTTINDVYEVLKLEVEKRNIENSKTPVVIEWLYELITSQIEPAMLAEETDYLQHLTEYLRTKQ